MHLRPRGEFHAVGGVEPSIICDVPRGRVTPLLPSTFSASSHLHRPGGATLLMGLMTCASGSVLGAPAPRGFSFGERVVRLRSVDGTPGLHVYAVDQVTDHPGLAVLLADVGFPVRLVDAPATGAGLRLDLGRTVSVPSPLTTVSVWHDDGEQLAKLVFRLRGARARAGLARATLDRGEPGAERLRPILGRDRARGIATENRFDVAATVFVGPSVRDAGPSTLQ